MGKVVEKFKAGMFGIELDAGKIVLATMAGKLRRNRIKIMNGDKVSVELSPYDLTKGRITYRHKVNSRTFVPVIGVMARIPVKAATSTRTRTQAKAHL